MKHLVICFVSCVLAAGVVAQVVVFPATDGVARSSQYEVFANGQPVPVYDGPVSSYAMFDFSGSVDVRVRSLARDVKWVDIRPFSSGIQPAFGSDSTIGFRLTAPCNLSIELNREWNRMPLFLFTNAPENNPPSPDDTSVVYFGPGLHEAGVIELKSNQQLYLAGGAVVEGIVVAQQASDVKIGGRGVLLGTRCREFSKDWRHMISLRGCRNVELRDIMIVDSHAWDVTPFDCEDVTIDNLRIFSDNGGDDGMDIVQCRRAKISRCFIRTKDDCIAIKSFGKTTNNTNGIDISGCVLWNAAWGNAIELGFELQTDSVKNIRVHDCDVIHVDGGAALSIHNADRSVVDHVVFEDIRVEDANHKLFDLALFISRYSSDGKVYIPQEETRYWHGIWDNVWALTPAERKAHAAGRGKITHVVFRNIEVIDGYKPFSVVCGWDDDHAVENVLFENIRFHGKRVKNAEELLLYQEFAKNIKIK